MSVILLPALNYSTASLDDTPEHLKDAEQSYNSYCGTTAGTEVENPSTLIFCSFFVNQSSAK